jgi:hypothetical protein
MRFAQMEWKIVLHHIVSCLTFNPAAKIVKGTVYVMHIFFISIS